MFDMLNPFIVFMLLNGSIIDLQNENSADIGNTTLLGETTAISNDFYNVVVPAPPRTDSISPAAQHSEFIHTWNPFFVFMENASSADIGDTTLLGEATSISNNFYNVNESTVKINNHVRGHDQFDQTEGLLKKNLVFTFLFWFIWVLFVGIAIILSLITRDKLRKKERENQTVECP